MKTLRDFAVGQTFGLVRTVDRHRPIYYAAASGDFNPIHVDERVGRAAGLGGAILQGMCTFAWLSDACAAYFDDPVRVRSVRARFARPVRPGDTITFAGRCTAIEGGTVRVEVEAWNQRREEVLKRATAEGFVGTEGVGGPQGSIGPEGAAGSVGAVGSAGSIEPGGER